MTRKPHTKLLRVVLSEVSGRGFDLWSLRVVNYCERNRCARSRERTSHVDSLIGIISDFLYCFHSHAIKHQPLTERLGCISLRSHQKNLSSTVPYNWGTYDIDDIPLLAVVFYDCIVLAFLVGLVLA
ncbi:hypothetical protein CY34DRAFT_612194 [Suillus luteus UH-Slu-Lm8-n1]|uniref:Unplaced genomic scaffold CY34scaffold_560, whole genome shotgun sequence n=1 Tax=Suillus luteus UH-Slu-Lm8-n1 TaxID=930992 RepID=A0A0D0AKT6_9AGAM|nr:hypothetical protein CY34DRAFT_612194 [Suillus luteus UH-Slu-Lm8-n1]